MAIESDVHAGTRIRERRLDLGLRQADLAKALGISPSYLNLIEHNRRRIAGTLLQAAGRVLDVDPTLLTQGAARSVLDQLRAAAANAEQQPEVDRTDELAARYPGWANVLASQQARIGALETRIQELTDRMTHDPELATSLHGVISAVTSIRSTAAILTSEEKLDDDWLSRFHKNIHDDALRLAGSSDALVRYLDAPSDQNVSLSPFDEANQFLALTDFHLAEVETGDVPLETIAQNANLSPFATQVLRPHLADYRRVATRMPLVALRRELTEAQIAPDRLAKTFNVPLEDVLLRLATLPADAGLPAMGFARCDGSGVVTVQKQIDGFSLSHNGLACPLWPLFTAIGQPDRPVRQAVVLPGQRQDRFLCYAIAGQTTGGFSMPPLVNASMLVIAADRDEADQDDVLPLGTTCRICPRDACPARREPSALGASL